MADAAAVGDSADVLARAIVAQAKEDAEKIRQAAQAEADQIIAEAQGRAVERHAAEGREQTDRIRKEMVTELALARFEAGIELPVEIELTGVFKTRRWHPLL